MAPGGTMPAHTPIPDFQPPEARDAKFLSLTPPGVWYSVTTDLVCAAGLVELMKTGAEQARV